MSASSPNSPTNDSAWGRAPIGQLALGHCEEASSSGRLTRRAFGLVRGRDKCRLDVHLPLAYGESSRHWIRRPAYCRALKQSRGCRAVMRLACRLKDLSAKRGDRPLWILRYAAVSAPDSVVDAAD